MPICDNHNNENIPTQCLATDVDRQADIAKVKITREQAYFNSYDFDAIEVVPLGEDAEADDADVVDCYSNDCDSRRKHSLSDTDDHRDDLGHFQHHHRHQHHQLHQVPSGAYLKRLTSYFNNATAVATNSAATVATTTTTITTAAKVSRLNKSSSSKSFVLPIDSASTVAAIIGSEDSSENRSDRSSSSQDSSRKLYNAGSSNDVNRGSRNSNFLLPRAMLKCQNSSASNSMSSSGVASSATSTISKICNSGSNGGCSSNGSGGSGGGDAIIYGSQKRPAGHSSSSNQSNYTQCCEKSNGRERVISSSHYSTDKSGSSGYYSSRVCSTSSVEEHIYSEPVIDIIQTTLVPLKQLTGPLQKTLEKHNNQGRHRTDVIIDDLPTGESYYVSKSHSKINDELRSLETSIKNLDQHLKNYSVSSVPTSIRTAGQLVYDEVPSAAVQIHEKTKSTRPMPTIMEGVDGSTVHPNNSLKRRPVDWPPEVMDDSLMDIDLDSFLLAHETGQRNPGKGGKAKKKEMLTGIDNPTFNESKVLNEEVLENNYRCSKYVNSCPEDAYKVESVINNINNNNSGSSSSNSNKRSHNAPRATQDKSLGFFLKRYEDQIHFQSTKDMLEDIRSRVNALTSLRNTNNDGQDDTNGYHRSPEIPRDVENYIAILKKELEMYLRLMNQSNEMEIKQFCTGLVNNQRLMTITKAFERRQSLASDTNSLSYEALRRPSSSAFHMSPYATESSIIGGGQNMNMVGIDDDDDDDEEITVVASSDPNFKLKRKSLVDSNDGSTSYYNGQYPVIRNNKIEVSGVQICDSVSSVDERIEIGANKTTTTTKASSVKSQLQRNLSLQRPRLDRKPSKIDCNDKDAMLDWHKNKPSIWEQYYGTNRINQTLTGKRGQLVKNASSILSYPSSRPESDFTLDLPRAEQLRIKMDKEKKFRQRCRILTTFLSLVFFLLTVMVVSLILTRGKRMFGSML